MNHIERLRAVFHDRRVVRKSTKKMNAAQMATPSSQDKWASPIGTAEEPLANPSLDRAMWTGR